jgi:hypothetical protein
LHETLALHNTETLMRKAALAAWRLQDRSARFLDLKKERVVVIGEIQGNVRDPVAIGYSRDLFPKPSFLLRKVR